MADWKESTKPPEHQVDWKYRATDVDQELHASFVYDPNHPKSLETNSKLDEFEKAAQNYSETSNEQYHKQMSACMRELAQSGADKNQLYVYIKQVKKDYGLNSTDVHACRSTIDYYCKQYGNNSSNILSGASSSTFKSDDKQRKPSENAGQAPGSSFFDNRGEC